MKIRNVLILFLAFTLNLSSLQAENNCARYLDPQSTESIEGERFRILFEGAGDVVTRYYLKAIQKFAQESPEAFAKMQIYIHDINDNMLSRLTARLEELGLSKKVRVLINGRGNDDHIYQNINISTLIVATPSQYHVDVAKSWVGRAKRIYIEKPVDADYIKAFDFLGRDLASSGTEVFALDHYTPKILMSQQHWKELFEVLGAIKAFDFYFVEDRSSADPNNVAKAGRESLHGPIEREDRVSTLNDGMMMDGLPHMFALLGRFADLDTFTPTLIKAGQYFSGEKSAPVRAEIKSETFAEVHFKLRAPGKANYIDGRAFVGKGVLGSRELGEEFNYDTKALVVTGNYGKATFDLRTNGTLQVSFVPHSRPRETRIFPLISPFAYESYIEEVVFGRLKDRDERVSLGLRAGVSILNIMSTLTIPTTLREGVLPLYPVGMGGERSSLLIEELNLEPIWQAPLLGKAVGE